jgi:outer membrane murein-binding lipoprotein Lpp
VHHEEHVERTLKQISERLERLMADVSKLNAAVATLNTHVDALITTTGGNDQPAVDQATAAVQAVDAKVVAATPAAA